MRNNQIEGLRGISSLIIVVFHLFYRFTYLYCSDIESLWYMKHWGTIGVVVFMSISAYFIYKEKLPQNNLFLYYWKKISRLWIPYVLCITITYICSIFLELPNRTITIKEYILNVFMVNGFVGTPYVDGAHWYITTLLSIILIIGVIKKLKLIDNYIVYIFWLGCAVVSNFFDINMLAFLIGGKYVGIVILSMLMHNIKDVFSNKIKLLLVIMSCGYSFCFDFIFGIIVLIFLPIVYLVVNQKIKVFASTIFVKLGVISYSLYLIHQNIGMMIIYKMMKMNNGIYNFYYSWIAIIIVYTLAFLIYNWYEKPINKLLKGK